jgi:two-component system LytT family sensor kinase
MKKSILLLLLVLTLFKPCFAQANKWANYSQTFPSGFDRDSAMVGIVANIEEQNNDFWGVTNTDSLEKVIRADSSFKAAPKNDYFFVSTFSNAPAYFFVKKNAAEYEYSVVQDKYDVLVPWSPITNIQTPGFGAGEGSPGEMGYIGAYTAKTGHYLVVQVRKKNSAALISTALVAWAPVYPALQTVFTPNELNDFLGYLNHSWKIKQTRKQQYAEDKPAEMLFKSTENSLVFYLTSTAIYDRKQIEYEVLKDDQVIVPWKVNDFDNCFIWLKNLAHGNYRLRIRYTVQPGHVTNIDFIIKPAWYQTTIIKVIVGSLVAVFLGLIIFLNILLIQKRRVAKEIAKKAKLEMELQIIRAQLNPHFIFNALSSIQGLVNKNDVANTNKYLSEFASLLRNTLVTQRREQIPLKQEMDILETYLKLEQLRFDFTYEIKADDTIALYETEIPSLLIQPLLENAIKHGIADLRKAGKLELSFKKNNQDMTVVIKDNGKGFTETENTAGFGLKLTKERIALLNNIVKNREIKLDIYSNGTNATEITLTFINWFHEN